MDVLLGVLRTILRTSDDTISGGWWFHDPLKVV